MSLSEVLADQARKRALVDDGVSEIEAEVASLGGVKGKAVGAGYAAVTKVKPLFVPHNIERLMPMAAPAIDARIEEAAAAGVSIPDHFAANADAIAEDLLAATDKRAEEANNPAAVKIYGKLRPSAKDRVVAAMPRLSRLVEKHC